MPLVVRAFPVLAGKEHLVRELAAALKTSRAAEAAEFYSRLGVRGESWHLQHTPYGVWVIGVTDVDSPEERAPQYAGSRHDFDVWFKEQVLALSGVDPEKQPLGPPTEEIFSFTTPRAG